tara:strand:- start:458 stop:772 length:315 start_codon:yes stop_codon:yes gene_type:complete
MRIRSRKTDEKPKDKRIKELEDQLQTLYTQKKTLLETVHELESKCIYITQCSDQISNVLQSQQKDYCILKKKYNESELSNKVLRSKLTTIRNILERKTMEIVSD